MHKKKIESQQDYIALVQELVEHDKHYYQEFKPVISDYEYDLMVKEVEKYEKEHPELALAESPTRRVFEGVSKGFIQKEHVTPMLSLQNTYSEKEVDDFLKRVEKILEKKERFYCVELKMDGTSISLRYENGHFVRALTRGDGRFGDDVTNNVRTIKNLPLKLEKPYPNILEVRGEVFMSLKTFQKINQEREEEGLEAWANPRNAAAGSLKLLDPKEVAQRELDLVVYAIVEGEEKITSQYEVHEYLKRLGLPSAKREFRAKCKNLTEIMDFA